MIEGIIYELASGLQPLAFLTKIGGMARAHQTNDGGTTRIFPVARTIVPEAVGENPYLDMKPGGHAGVVYFELLGDGPAPDSRPPRYIRSIASVRLVGHVNLHRLNPPNAEQAALNVLRYIPETLPDTSLAQMIRIEFLGFEPKGPGVFSRYNYPETESQYMTWPYDHFAINLRVHYTFIPTAVPECVDAVEMLPEPC